MTIQEAMKVVVKEIKTDPGYQISWQANIAMAFKDQFARFADGENSVELNYEQVHAIANRAAYNFIETLCRE